MPATPPHSEANIPFLHLSANTALYGSARLFSVEEILMNHSDYTIRSIDIGYGNTKFVKAIAADGGPITDHFPSIVHRPSGSRQSITDTSDGIYKVIVDGIAFDVGPDLSASFEADHRVLHDNFIDTSHYMALYYGALSQMDTDEIDLLMVGLPVDLMDSKREELESKLQGHHKINGSRTVNIKKVNAIAQPLGGFLNYMATSDLMSELNSATNLLIDPGFFTVDFLLTKGLRDIRSKSGSHPTGMSSYLEAIANEISAEYKINYTNISQIDQCLHSGGFKLYGKDVDLAKYHEKAVSAIMPGVEEIANKVGEGEDVHRIILVGGGANVFLDSIKAIFPNHSIELDSSSSIISNVLGYQLLGNAWASKQPTKEG